MMAAVTSKHLVAHQHRQLMMVLEINRTYVVFCHGEGSGHGLWCLQLQVHGCAQLLSVQHCSCPFAISILWCWQNHCTSQLLPLVATGQLTGQLTGLAFGRAFAQVPVWSMCPLVVTKLCYSGSFAFCFGSSAAGRQISMTTCLFLWPPVEPFMAAVRLYYSSTPSWCCAVCAELTLLAARALEPACAWTASGRLHSSLVTRGSKALNGWPYTAIRWGIHPSLQAIACHTVQLCLAKRSGQRSAGCLRSVEAGPAAGHASQRAQ